MFQPLAAASEPTLRPRDSNIRESDWRVLASLWHPVAFLHELTERPLAARLLDVDLVVYRTSAGISVAQDRCPHRGTRMSLGRIVEDRLRCPMHGLLFDGTGHCTRIPSIADAAARIPAPYRLTSIRAEVRYGIVWACLSGTPTRALPQWRPLEHPERRMLYFPVEHWQAAAPRHVENFNDLAHFPWVHIDSFGGDPDNPVPDYEVRHTDYGLTFEVPYTEGFNRFPDGVPGTRRDVVYRYELTLPFATLLTVEPQGSDYALYFADAVCPVSAHESRIFQLSTDTTGAPDEELWLRDALTINREDRPLVESQQPKDLPLKLRDELHIPADRMSIAYRRALAGQLGLGRP